MTAVIEQPDPVRISAWKSTIKNTSMRERILPPLSSGILSIGVSRLSCGCEVAYMLFSPAV